MKVFEGHNDVESVKSMSPGEDSNSRVPAKCKNSI